MVALPLLLPHYCAEGRAQIAIYMLNYRLHNGWHGGRPEKLRRFATRVIRPSKLCTKLSYRMWIPLHSITDAGDWGHWIVQYVVYVHHFRIDIFGARHELPLVHFMFAL